MSGLSNRGHLNLKQVVANIPKKILKPTADASVIDLSMAENHLIREEILQIVKSSIAGDLLSQVCDMRDFMLSGDSDVNINSGSILIGQKDSMETATS